MDWKVLLLIIIPSIFGIINFNSTYRSNTLIQMHKSELNKSRSKSFSITMISIYFSAFVIAFLPIFVLSDLINSSIDVSRMIITIFSGTYNEGVKTIIDMYLMENINFSQIALWIIVLYISSSLAFFIIMTKKINKKLKEKTNQIFNKKNIYNPDLKKYSELDKWTYLYINLSGFLNGMFFFTLLSGQNINDFKNLFLLCIILSLYQLVQASNLFGLMATYAFTHNLKKYNFVKNTNESLCGYLIGEDRDYLIIKPDNDTVTYLKKDLIDIYKEFETNVS
ncbi:hypothetical protein [Paraliobacillus salinarum]|uniref:hypothetical protein n=1 Tax=Paraliobacillus salinarum TaxID=1158996 RepID=UPI0015F55372|nr:hypothetical protein [Paraliobacillus salinarum]